MATRTSALQRALNYFRTADRDEVRVAFALAGEIVKERLSQVPQPTAKAPVRRTRKVTAPQAATSLKPGDIIRTDETLADA